VLAAIDLTQRQAARVLEQAVRTHARVEIEARSREGIICGTLAERHDHLLCIHLHDQGRDWPLAGLLGAFCDVKTVLSGHLYVFSTCIVDVADQIAPQRMFLEPPGAVQVVNRRKFDRKNSQEAIEVQFWPPGAPQPIVGRLCNIGLGGLGCRGPRAELEDLLLIGEQIRITFQLPEAPEIFDLMAVICVKTAAGDGQNLDVGLEFPLATHNDPAAPNLVQLRTVLARSYAQDTNPEAEE
jgi:hypothetical protein